MNTYDYKQVPNEVLKEELETLLKVNDFVMADGNGFLGRMAVFNALDSHIEAVQAERNRRYKMGVLNV